MTLAGLRKSSSLPQVMEMLNTRRTQERGDKTAQQQMLESQSRVAESKQRLAHGPIGLRQLAARDQQHKQSMAQAEQQYRDTLAFNRQKNIETQAHAAETNRIRRESAMYQNLLRRAQAQGHSTRAQKDQQILEMMQDAMGGQANSPRTPLSPEEIEFIKQQQQLNQQ